MKKFLLVLIVLSSLPLSVSAATHRSTWQVCHLQVQIIKHLTSASLGRSLQARVLHVRAAPAVSDCPATGSIITFEPDTPDYQNKIPYKRWPKAGQKIKMRYQYLDGYCKNDNRGGDTPCRIENYPVP
jgi:hypothetical protein